MSTKTTFKRIALVAVAALGLGVVSSVAPATAAPATYTVGTATNSPAVTGATFTVTVPLTFTAAPVNDTATVTILNVTKPSGSAITHTILTQTVTTVGTTGVILTPAAVTVNSSSVNTITTTATRAALASTDTARVVNSVFTLSVDRAGAYMFAVLDDIDATGTLTSGDGVQYITINVADSPAAAVVLSTDFAATYATYNSTSGVGTNGALVRVSVRDSAGAATVLGGAQAVSISVPSTMSLVAKAKSGNPTDVAPVSNGSFALVQADFNSSGVAYVRLRGTSAGVSTLTANVIGSASAAASLSVTYKTVTAAATTAGALTNLSAATVAAGAAVVNASGINVTAATTGTVSSSSTTYGFGVVASTAGIYGATVSNLSTTNSGSTLFGGGTLGVDLALDGSTLTSADAQAATATNGSAGLYLVTQTIGVAIARDNGGRVREITIEPVTTVTTNTKAQLFTLQGIATAGTTLTRRAPSAASVIQAPASTVNVTARCTDQFGAARANSTLTPVLTGRNAALVTLPTLVTNASGDASFSYVDASTSTTSLTDVISATGCSASATTILTVNFSSSSTLGVSKVTWTAGGGFADKDYTVGYSKTAISSGDDPSANAAATLTFTVLDANGAPVVGAPYTAVLSGNTKSAIRKTSTVDSANGFTTSTGISIPVFAWAPGTSTVTVTVGGTTATGYVTWKSSAAAADARKVAVADGGNGIVKVTVTDRFGNGIDGVTVNLTRTGTGYFASGTSTSTAITDGDGTVDVQFIGEGSVTARLATSSVQAYDAKGFIGGVAVTAAVSGTTTGTGNTFADAGVSSATVSVVSSTTNAAADAASAAADAAAEATDAANAATDAANAAAEAADAATAAAQDAADAVAALSTQVSEMIDALKKQITALTNLVIKIQKKVKA
jgi:hypothetical protein